MPRLPIAQFGRGRVTAQNATKIPLGAARDSLNLLHNIGVSTATLRAFMDRVNATAPAALPVLMLHELVVAAGTITLLAKVGTVLYTWSLTPGTAMSSILTGLDATHLPGVCTAGGAVFVADFAVNNYITQGTSGTSHEFQKSGPEGTMSLAARADTAVGNAADTALDYYMTDLEPNTGEETPPNATTTVNRTTDDGVAITGLTYTGHFTSKRIYRVNAGLTQPYLVVTLAISATTFRARSTNVATITTAAAHSLQVGQSVTITGLPAAYNVTVAVASTPTTTTFTYSNVAADEGSTADTAGTVYKAGYLDDSLDSALTTASEVHDADGAASIEKPEAAKFCCFFKGRLFLANLSVAPSRIRWSKVLEPTQFSNATTARLDVGKNDGGEITGIVPFRGSLVIFKTNSIWVMNGDEDETTFSIFEAVPGKGCVAPWTIRRDGDSRIFFLSAAGVLTFDLSGVPEIPLSDPILADVRTLADRRDFFCAGLDTRERLYLLSVAPAAATTNTKTHVLNLDTGAWGRFQFAMGEVTPSCYGDTGQSGPIRNSVGQVLLYFGDEVGYVYQTDATTTGDGVTSGTTEATITAVTGTTTSASAAAFRTTGDGLKGLGLTLRRAADSTYETVRITSATGTVITHAAWVGTAAAISDTIFVGALQATLSLGRIDLETNRRKRWHRIEVEFEKQTATTPLRVGYTLDGDTAPTATGEFAMSNNYFARKRIDRRALALSPYLDVIGTNYDFDLLRMHVDVDVLAVGHPAR